MQCDYFDAGACRSCTLMGEPYAQQLAGKDARVRSLLGDRPGLTWSEPFASAESAFRAKAKMVVGGTPAEPTLGILDRGGHGVDLRGCGVIAPAASAALPVIADFVSRVGLRPYDVPRRSGELKHVHVTQSPDGGLMVRFVLRSEGQIGRLQRHLPELRDRLPNLTVVTANLLPEHKAAVEGSTEIPLTSERDLPMRLDDVTLYAGPGAFVQTNTVVATGLYRQARDWIDEAAPASVLDLYCGIGGFALHASRPGRTVTGVEVSAEAITSARRSASEARVDTRFVVGDATAFAEDLAPGDMPDLVVVNPPRRGLGERLSRWLNASEVPTVLYSSCNPTTLVRDLAAMPNLSPVHARVFDMFPQTDHAEVLVLLRRQPAALDLTAPGAHCSTTS